MGNFGERGQSGCYALLTSDSRFVRGHAKVNAAGYELAEHDADTRDRIATHPNGRRLVVSETVAYLLSETSLSAINRINASAVWSITCDCPYALILAGDVLFAGGTNKVVGYGTANGQEFWSRNVQGRARGLAAAEGRLYVSTDTGRIYMFGSANLPADLNKDGTVDLLDLAIFGDEYLKCTDPASTQRPCQNLQSP